jgi:hypothetical protein
MKESSLLPLPVLAINMKILGTMCFAVRTTREYCVKNPESEVIFEFLVLYHLH